MNDKEAADAQRWADRLGMKRSELLRDSLRRYLGRLESEGEANRRRAKPLTAAESMLGAIADWGMTEDWSDWADSGGSQVGPMLSAVCRDRLCLPEC